MHTACLLSRFYVQKGGNCIIPSICLCSRFCVSERGKLHHTYNIFMFQIVCTRKKETALYLQYVYVLDCVYQEEGNCIIPTICLCSRFCASERGKLCHTYNMFMFQIVFYRKRESVSYLHYVYFPDFVYQKEGNCIIPTISLCSIFCVFEREKLYHSYSMFMMQLLCIRKTETVWLVSKLCVSEIRNLCHSNMIGTFWQRKIKSNCIPI